MSAEFLAFGVDLTHEQERAFLLHLVGPRGLYTIMVPPSVHDAVKDKYPDLDLPKLIRQECMPLARQLADALGGRIPAHPQPRPLPYPPRLKGRYAR